MKNAQQPNLLLRSCAIFGLAALFYFYDNLLQVAPAAMRPELTEAFAKDAQSFGSLSAVFLWAYGIMQIPVGLLMDRYGPRRLLSLACLLAATGSLIFGLADTLLQAKLARLLMGLGASFAVVGCLKISSLWFHPKRFALLTGMMVTVGFLGSISALSLISNLVMEYTWRTTMKTGGFVGFGILILLWTLVRDKPPAQAILPQTKMTTGTHQMNFQSLMSGLFSLMKSKQVWVASVYAALMFVPTLAFGGLWGIPFLEEAHQFDRNLAGKMISLIYLGWVFGAPFFGWVSDYLGRRNRPMLIASSVVFALCLLIIYLPLSRILLGLALFGLGFFSSSFILAFAVVRESNLPLLAGTAIGFVNALNTFGGAFMQPMIGKILDLNSKTQLAENATTTVFTLSEYRTAFLSIPVCIGISLILLFFLKETFCKSMMVSKS